MLGLNLNGVCVQVYGDQTHKVPVTVRMFSSNLNWERNIMGTLLVKPASSLSKYIPLRYCQSMKGEQYTNAPVGLMKWCMAWAPFTDMI